MNTARVSGAHAISATAMGQVLHPGRAYPRPAQVVADTRISLAWGEAVARE